MTVTTAEQALVDAAREARAGAYAPYSGFKVGAALRTSAGEVFTGANVENAAYPATLCAERVAVGHAVARGARSFSQIAVIGTGPAICTPCGTCRQVLNEFAPDIEVLAASERGEVARFVLRRDLLPEGFGPEALEGR
ncbi:MAG TPA: cytidine deaminase [Euzebyales bacterium]|nr:cytidine deaminase [Euzebyales bacterium]